MFEYIKGILVEVTPQKAVIDVNGIGYSLFIPLSTYTKMPPPGKEVLVYISAIIREDSHKYFAFITRSERDLFKRLSDISGIGPKTALNLVGHMESSDLESAITHANISLLSKIPGIGKKTAERLIVEMRDKIKKMPNNATPSPFEMTSLSPKDRTVNDALSALINLGYNTLQAQQAIKKALEHCNDEPELSELIRVALKGL
jgi:Holliday junction DNA helicase RuvA